MTVGALIRWFPRDELPSLVRFTVNAFAELVTHRCPDSQPELAIMLRYVPRPAGPVTSTRRTRAFALST